jgi:hypothetical protein
VGNRNRNFVGFFPEINQLIYDELPIDIPRIPNVFSPQKDFFPKHKFHDFELQNNGSQNDLSMRASK